MFLGALHTAGKLYAVCGFAEFNRDLLAEVVPAMAATEWEVHTASGCSVMPEELRDVLRGWTFLTRSTMHDVELIDGRTVEWGVVGETGGLRPAPPPEPID